MGVRLKAAVDLGSSIRVPGASHSRQLSHKIGEPFQRGAGPQAERPPDNGSLGVYCTYKNIPYENPEAQEGKLDFQIKNVRRIAPPSGASRCVSIALLRADGVPMPRTLRTPAVAVRSAPVMAGLRKSSQEETAANATLLDYLGGAPLETPALQCNLFIGQNARKSEWFGHEVSEVPARERGRCEVLRGMRSAARACLRQMRATAVSDSKVLS